MQHAKRMRIASRAAALLVAAASLSIPARAQQEEVITFEEEEILGFKPGTNEYTLIQDYVTDLADLQTRTVIAYTSALANFETAIRSAASTEARADIMGTMLKEGLNLALGMVLKGLGASNPGDLGGKTYGELGEIAPGIGPVVAVFGAVGKEIDRAAKAAESYEVGTWIRQERTQIVEAYGKTAKTGELRSQLGKELQAARDEAEEGEEDAAQNEFLVRVDKAQRQIRADIVPAVSDIERTFYESWINGHFHGTGEKAPGCIEMKVDTEGPMDEVTLSLYRAGVQSPMGGQIADALNGMQRQGKFQKLLDLDVRKRICYCVENFVGGTGWSCGWLERDNSELLAPIHRDSKDLFARHAGWNWTNFIEPDTGVIDTLTRDCP